MDNGILFTKALALFTMLGNVATVLLLVSALIIPSFYHRVMIMLARHSLLLGFLISSFSTVGSIIYSEVMGFAACILCWIQRIFMYPLLFVFGLALWRRDTSILPYALLLSLIGGFVAMYQWTKDMLAIYGNTILPCPAVTTLPSCDKILVLENGYITIPMIALNAFILISIVQYAGIRAKNKTTISTSIEV